MDINLTRGDELRREVRQLPAELYNKILLLFSRQQKSSLFVPVRAMQYLAIIDADEIVFVDGQGPRVIELAWQRFRSREREDLHAPVSYECVYYDDKGVQTMQRLQGELFKALEAIEERLPRPHGATVTNIGGD
jgi:hypothetical protein